MQLKVWGSTVSSTGRLIRLSWARSGALLWPKTYFGAFWRPRNCI